MTNDITNIIYNTLKTYLQAKSVYSPKVLKKVLQTNDKFPLVTLVEQNNIFNLGTTKIKKREIIDAVYWEINIYAVDQTNGTNIISNAQICDELKILIDKVMSDYFQLDRTMCEPTPNLDSSIYRITMRYSGKILENRIRLI